MWSSCSQQRGRRLCCVGSGRRCAWSPVPMHVLVVWWCLSTHRTHKRLQDAVFTSRGRNVALDSAGVHSEIAGGVCQFETATRSRSALARLHFRKRSPENPPIGDVRPKPHERLGGCKNAPGVLLITRVPSEAMEVYSESNGSCRGLPCRTRSFSQITPLLARA